MVVISSHDATSGTLTKASSSPKAEQTAQASRNREEGRNLPGSKKSRFSRPKWMRPTSNIDPKILKDNYKPILKGKMYAAKYDAGDPDAFGAEALDSFKSFSVGELQGIEIKRGKSFR